jgi:hypothetical protein
LKALSGPVSTYLADRNAPGVKQLALTVQDIFIENDQRCTRSSKYSGAVYSREWSRNA